MFLIRKENSDVKRSKVLPVTDKVAFSNDEKLMSLFQPDVLLADQFAATFRARDSLGPEKRLILASWKTRSIVSRNTCPLQTAGAQRSSVTRKNG